MHKAKRTPRQISLLQSVSRPRSIFRQLRKLGTFSRQIRSFYRFRGEKRIQKRPEIKYEQDVSLSRASSANTEQTGEERSYRPVPRQRDIGAPVLGEGGGHNVPPGRWLGFDQGRSPPGNRRNVHTTPPCIRGDDSAGWRQSMCPTPVTHFVVKFPTPGKAKRSNPRWSPFLATDRCINKPCDFVSNYDCSCSSSNSCL